MSVMEKLRALGLVIPKSPAPAANYVPWARSGNLVFISGQIPKAEDGSLMMGKVGASCSLDDGKAAARVVAVNIVAQMSDACGGNLDKVKRILKVEGFVNCTDDFKDHPQVINGISDLLVEIFGPTVGPHSRFAVGCSSLPLGVSVEAGAVIEIE
eukprot:CAMPEP_0178422770 /NCGR_PEP_ID=MMETSP0689_2-20121128/27345_1 /TAXON_ID=160604 /ORGANISM="Amphidinium massartii, Strain CS-259" /LENGTH=154 /DNA_ID=CAMNT_0020044345 /DNA_START=29 /DNA_END=490 /DNA_ORIENTATION=-